MCIRDRRQVEHRHQENHKWSAWRSGGDMDQVRGKSFTRLGMTQATGLKSVRLRESGFGVAGREYGVRTMTVDASGRSLTAEIDGFPVVGVQIRLDTYHGKAVNLGRQAAATCVD